MSEGEHSIRPEWLGNCSPCFPPKSLSGEHAESLGSIWGCCPMSVACQQFLCLLTKAGDQGKGVLQAGDQGKGMLQAGDQGKGMLQAGDSTANIFGGNVIMGLKYV